MVTEQRAKEVMNLLEELKELMKQVSIEKKLEVVQNIYKALYKDIPISYEEWKIFFGVL